MDKWEQYVDNGAIPENYFLTKQTAEGLRVTLKSTLDLVQYLTLNAGFDYVSTGRLNQDPLEVSCNRLTLYPIKINIYSETSERKTEGVYLV